MIGNFIACRQTLMRYKILSCSIDWNWPHNILTLFFDEHLVFEGLHLYNSAVKDGKKDIRMVIVFFVIFFIRFLYFRLDDYTNQGFFRLLPWLSTQFYIKISHFAKTYQVFLSSSVIIRTRNNFFYHNWFSCAMSWTYCWSHFS